jgi:hypothetical protein
MRLTGSYRAPRPSGSARRTGRPICRPCSASRTGTLARLLVACGAVVLTTAIAVGAEPDATAAGSAGWVATSLVPGTTRGELLLQPNSTSASAPTFPAGVSIDGLLRTTDPLSHPGIPIALRLFRDDPVEGLIMTWGALYEVRDGQTELAFGVPGQEPGAYRLLAYHALTEPLALAEIRVDGEPSALPTPPAVPEGWQQVTSASGDLVLHLPADFGAVVDRSTIIANPPPDAAGGLVGVLAESALGAERQPLPGAQLGAWLEERWFKGEHAEWSHPVTMAVRLPAGEAVRLMTSTYATSRPWSASLYAIRTPDGVSFVAIDGPADVMSLREADLELIPRLISYP